MKELLLLRHAKAEAAAEALSDAGRRLTERGRHDGESCAGHIAAGGAVPDYIIASPALRAVETWEIIRGGIGSSGELFLDAGLYGAGPEVFFRILSEIPDRAIRCLIIAHNPGIEDFLARITQEPAPLKMRAGSLALVRFTPAKWNRIVPGVKGELVDFWSPG